MTAIRIETTIQSDTLYLPQLKQLVGKSVEIVVREVTQQADQVNSDSFVGPLAGSVIDYSNPFEATISAVEWEANR